MLRRLTPVLFLFLIACSDSGSTDPKPSQCSEPENLRFENDYVYTWQTYEIKGSKICVKNLEAVMFNDIEIREFTATISRITFQFPVILTDSADVKLKTSTGIIDLQKKVAIYPSTGFWTERQSFPAPGRAFGMVASSGTSGYIIAGQRYTGFTDTYNDTYYGDVYSYQPADNAWTLVKTDDKFKYPSFATVANGKVFSFKNYGTPADIYDIAGNSFTTSGSHGIGNSVHIRAFNLKNEAYLAFAQRVSDVYFFGVKKYNSDTKAWDLVQTVSLGASTASFLVNFAFEYKDKAYLGVTSLNGTTVTLWKFNPASSEITQESTTNVSGSFYLLTHLFTIGDIAYFIEPGESSVGPTSSDVRQPSNTLYLYNFKVEAWEAFEHEYPEPFYAVKSFSIGNRGFAGMGVTANSPLFDYSVKFYEFTPQ